MKKTLALPQNEITGAVRAVVDRGENVI